MLIRLNRSPDAGDAGGGAVVPDAPDAPDSQAPATEAPESTPETPTGTPETSPQAAELSDEDVIKRASERSRKNPNYKMTDAEFEAWERLERGDKGQKPKAKPSSKPQAESQTEPGEAPVDAQAQEDADSEAPTLDPKLAPILEKLGAKSVEELPERVEGLIKLRDELNGRAGKWDAEKRTMETRLTQTQENYAKQQAFIKDYLAGDPAAIAYAKAKGLVASPSQPARTQEPAQDFNKYLDPDLAKWAQSEITGLKSKFEQELQTIKQQNQVLQQKHHEELAREQVVAEMTSLAEKFQELRPQSGSIRELFQEFYKGYDGDPIDPRLQPMLDVIELMKETLPDGRRKYPDLETAYAVHAFKKMPERLVKAQREGRQALAGHKPTVGLSDQQGRTSGNFKQYTEADYEAMTRNPDLIPADWMDKQGNLQFQRIPKGLRDLFQAQFG